MKRVFRQVLHITVFSLGLTFFGCSSEDAVNLVSPENPFITPNQFLSFDSDSLANPINSTQNFSIDSGYTTGGFSFVGTETNGVKSLTATTYLSFWAGDFPNLDTASAVSARLKLRMENWQDSLSGQTLQFEIRTVTESWVSSDMRSKGPLTIGTEKLAEFSFTIDDSSSQELELPLSFAQDLLSDIQKGEDYLLDSSKGLALLTTSATTLASVDFSESQLRLTLNRKTTSGGEERLSKLLDVSRSAYSVETNYAKFESDALYLQSVTADAAQLSFDLNFLEPNFQISKATLSLVLDTLYNKVDQSQFSVGVGLAEADLSTNAGTSIKIFTVDSTSTLYTATVTQMVQNWALNKNPNNGFIIRPFQELSAFNRWRFFGSNEAVGLRPRLVITYTVSN
jgi:hypothetical protein